ncbi:hypothetical protein HISP_19120 (plasmid) [Haloarcula hispanica N601]|uniref:Uncharacterized protein n=2 Tax=Haloarcula hispanica TaxID=51589 RepID=V5TTB8_HALHI|nr:MULTISPECIES: hypothetical protein [Haloarcula]AEM59322.1 conserved hypothetical protein [Haloarcula hispanica ATCC 33960]AHB68177.1 hypothetical protein HISP_19120 [Haloarcula hispanica N601]AJF27502.1 hypothetical protein SG26_17130 [Haloarcula sp. CBA1115]KAA9404228.1 hypothetical protein Har1131_15490 [Haloarcula sp. CBA1131]KZX46388.1 hypothetical protein AV929_07765 [Haloarcula sp. K1]
MLQFPVQLGSGLLESVGQVAAVAGTVVLLLMLVGLGAFAYKSLIGDGIRWPDEREEADSEEDDGVVQGSREDDWKYY